VGKGRVAAMLGMVTIVVFALGIEAAKAAYFSGGSLRFSLINLLCGVLWFCLVRAFLSENKRRSTLAVQE
jgi:DHA1 family multidrug/chloramphenicol efflux transport protein-like MFS transporter